MTVFRRTDHDSDRTAIYVRVIGGERVPMLARKPSRYWRFRISWQHITLLFTLLSIISGVALITAGAHLFTTEATEHGDEALVAADQSVVTVPAELPFHPVVPAHATEASAIKGANKPSPATNPAIPNSPPENSALPPSSDISGFRVSRQDRNLNCEFSSAADLATFYNKPLLWRDLFSVVGYDPNGNPNVGFVGASFDDPAGSLYPRGYGVYAEPIARALRRYGLAAKAYEEVDVYWLKVHVGLRRPVIVWVTYGLSEQPLVTWWTSDGKMQVRGVRGEHTMTVVGYTPTTVSLADPAMGTIRRFGWEDFLRSWAYLGNMAVAVE